MRGSGDSGRRKRPAGGIQAQDRAGHRGRGQADLSIVGIGPGGRRHMSARALEVLAGAEVVAGYTTYIELIRPLIAGKQVITTGMRKEVDRCRAAIDLATAGTACALVCSGDPGIYALAGLVLEICRSRKLDVRLLRNPDAEAPAGGLTVEVVPGIPALSATAALLGAPLMHDFAAVSLSDLLTPWPVIEQRLEAAARADFVIVLYNPKSRKRPDHLARAVQIVSRHRPADTPAGVVVAAGRLDQQVHLTTLAHLADAPVDMQTTVIIGNRSSFAWQGMMITPRGYGTKYELK